ncbi:MAG: GNAT family N-acetyltransferase [Eubacteriales bacterium]|nr:GNAT family N-acetyltransferase [Eubacteriales bacterium]
MELSLYKPNKNDLWFRQKLLADEETMLYNKAWGGVIDFEPEKWQNWYNKWILEHESERFYRYLLDVETKEWVGEIAYHYDETKRRYLLNLIILAKHRKKGYGKAGLRLLCEIAKGNGIKEVYDDIAIDNPAIILFKEEGFMEVGQKEEYILLRKKL